MPIRRRRMPRDPTRTASVIHIAVDRAGVPPGNYFGQVRIESNGGSAVITVAMSAGLTYPPPPNVPIRVRAVRVDTGQTVQQATVNPTTSLTWYFAALPQGEYDFVADTDLDGDGVPCEDGDSCGSYPREGEAEPVPIVAGVSVTSIDFAVAPHMGLSAAGSAVAAPPRNAGR